MYVYIPYKKTDGQVIERRRGGGNGWVGGETGIFLIAGHGISCLVKTY